jgi:hypothetical protein
MNRTETKTRSLVKTVVWRIIATINSYAILMLFNDFTISNLAKAIYMNISGFFVYYIFERTCNAIKWGIK